MYARSCGCCAKGAVCSPTCNCGGIAGVGPPPSNSGVLGICEDPNIITITSCGVYQLVGAQAKASPSSKFRPVAASSPVTSPHVPTAPDHDLPSLKLESLPAMPARQFLGSTVVQFLISLIVLKAGTSCIMFLT